MDNDIEKILEQALIKLEKEKAAQIKGECLTDNDMASLLDGKIPAAKRDAIFEHLLSCPKCAKEVKENLEDLNDIETKGLMETPKELIQSAIDLVKPEETPHIEESKQPWERELVTTMRFAKDSECPYSPASLMIRNFKVICPPFARGGRTSAPPRIIKKIYFNCNHNCYVYLFEIREKTIKVILQKQKFLKKAKNELSSKIKKPLGIPKKGKLVLIFTRKAFKDVSSVKKIMLIIPGATSIKLANMLKQEDHNVVVKFI